ncbi:MAG: ABC transporter ATP-binding protein [Clostridiales bacterium]|nr:ABC transporter ATP-binding protein [Clostridiales bacterium]
MPDGMVSRDMALEIDDLSGGYGGADVVKHIHCAAQAGEILCLIGPNGCGKTTLFRLILGMIPASGGEIRLGGKPSLTLPPAELARHIAYIPQYHTPAFAYTALDVVIMGRAGRISPFGAPKREDRDAAFAALDKLKISRLANAKYTSLSGGQRQMVLIARAICQSASIFMMDEPGASLDYANQQLLMNVTASLAEQGYCVVMSTHSPEHPLAIGHKALLMRGGEAVAFGRPTEVITPEILQEVYGIEIDVVTAEDRYGAKRTICLPVSAEPSPVTVQGDGRLKRGDL